MNQTFQKFMLKYTSLVLEGAPFSVFLFILGIIMVYYYVKGWLDSRPLRSQFLQDLFFQEQSLRNLFCPCNFHGDVSMHIKGSLMLDWWNKTGTVSSENSNRSKENNLFNCRVIMTVIYNENCLQAFHSLIIDWNKPFGILDAATEFSFHKSSVCWSKYE